MTREAEDVQERHTSNGWFSTLNCWQQQELAGNRKERAQKVWCMGTSIRVDRGRRTDTSSELRGRGDFHISHASLISYVIANRKTRVLPQIRILIFLTPTSGFDYNWKSYFEDIRFKWIERMSMTTDSRVEKTVDTSPYAWIYYRYSSDRNIRRHIQCRQ